jgi:hypothetical protein
MADQQDRSDETPDAAAPAEQQASSPSPDPVPPAAEPPAPPVPPAKKTPAKAAANKAPAKKAAKKTPAKKAPAKKAAKKTPAKKAPPKKAPAAAAKLADTNGDLTSAAKEAAAQAKSAVSTASNPVSGTAPVPLIGPDRSRLPIAAAIAAGVLAILVVLLARRHSDD